MVEVSIVPKVRCDNCGFTDEKEMPAIRGAVYRRKEGWGGIRIDPTQQGGYPNNIAFVDLCPACLKLVHDAATKALEQGRGK